MKKLFALTVAMLSMIGMSANPITPEKALQIAQEYMVPGHTMTMQTQAKSRRASAVSAPYYVISRGENQGYVIVAGDDCMPEILGYTEQGDFDESNIPEGLQDMLNAWTEMIEAAQENGTNVSMAATRRAATSTRTDIAPFVTSHWHQDSPYNDNCPTLTSNGNRAVTGCVATAASQILYYWRKDLPSTLQATTPTYGYGDAPVTRSVPKGTPLKWDLMLDQYGSQSSEYKQAVAEFVFATGAATWLTYGSSTSGNIEKIPYTFSTYYGMNGGTVHYRNSYSQEKWTQLLYDELAKGRPVMYTGVHPSNGGHAVFIHGYKADKDLFYFNFGWGGQSDGYYTTTTTDGMNGFCGDQSALIEAYPKSWNMSVSIVPPTHVYANIENEFTIRIENNSTLDFSGVYLYASTSSTVPSGSAKSKDDETVIATGSAGEIVLKAKPTSSGRVWYITVTDENKNVLARISVTPEVKESELYLKKLSVDGSDDVEIYKNEEYHVVYNTKVTGTATVEDISEYGYDGSLRLYIYSYDESAQTWNEVGYKSGSITIGAHASADATFSILSTASCPLEVGKYYMGRLDSPGYSTTDVIHYTDVSDPCIRFVFREGDMEAVGFEDRCLTMKGHFDNTFFNTTAKKSAYKTATLYDLTQCASVGTVTQTINPNALIYVADDSKAAGVNVVCAGKCTNLSLVTGYDFTPRADFVAEKAALTVNGKVARWCLVTSPFDAPVPDGIVAREIVSHTFSGISSGVKEVKVLEAGKTYLVMSSRSDNMTFTAENVTVMAAPVGNTDTAVVGTYVNTTTPASSQLLNDEEKQYFVPVDEGTVVEAFSGYWCASDLTKTFRAYPNMALDPAYVIFAQSIEDGYQILAKYSRIVTEAAYESYLAELQAAEAEFSKRGEEATLGSSTQIKNYAAQLLADGETYMKQIGNLGNAEIDFTGNIANPSFETETTKGWTLGVKEGYTSVSSVIDGTAANDNRAVGVDGKYVFQSLIAKADSTSVGISQLVENLTPGYYRLTAMLGTDEDHTVTMFAGDATVTVSGHPFGHLYMTKAVIDNVKVLYDEGSDTGSLQIGVVEGRWYKADNFKLTYVKMLDKDDIPDAINDVTPNASLPRKGIYTLQGVKLSSIMQPGIYIVDGKKQFRMK